MDAYRLNEQANVCAADLNLPQHGRVSNSL